MNELGNETRFLTDARPRLVLGHRLADVLGQLANGTISHQRLRILVGRSFPFGSVTRGAFLLVDQLSGWHFVGRSDSREQGDAQREGERHGKTRR